MRECVAGDAARVAGLSPTISVCDRADRKRAKYTCVSVLMENSRRLLRSLDTIVGDGPRGCSGTAWSASEGAVKRIVQGLRLPSSGVRPCLKNMEMTRAKLIKEVLQESHCLGIKCLHDSRAGIFISPRAPGSKFARP